MESVTIALEDTSYVPDQTEPSSSELSDDTVANAIVRLRRAKLNEFLVASGKPVLTQQRKPWGEQVDSRTKFSYVAKARDAVVSALEVIIPDDAGALWNALKRSGEVESALGVVPEPNPADDKYLHSLAETYQNAASWDTRRQVLSIMADLVPYNLLQRYLPGITEYRVKTARKHRIQYGRGSPVPVSTSPRMRVNYAQVDHFLDFIASPHVIQDLPFGQRLLSLSDGSVLETPNLIRYRTPTRNICKTTFRKQLFSKYH